MNVAMYDCKLPKDYSRTSVILPGFLCTSRGCFFRRVTNGCEAYDSIRMTRTEAFAVAAVVASLGFAPKVVRVRNPDSRYSLYGEATKLFSLASQLAK